MVVEFESGKMFPLVTTECLNSTAPTELSILTATFSSLFLVVTVPTNLLVCLAVIIDPNKELRTQFNCFTFNLALADLTVGCITEAIFVYFHVKESMDSEFGHEFDAVMQKVLHTSFFITAVASAFTIAALAWERYLAVTSPLRYRQYFDVCFSIKLSVIIWIIAFGLGSLNIFLDYYLQCFIIVNSVLVFVGLAVCFSCFKIHSTIRNISTNWAEIGLSTSGAQHYVETQKLLTKTFEIMIVALLCCYIPVCIMIYYMNLCQECNCDVVQWFRDAFLWLILFNSVINPFIYAYRNPSFRSAVRVIIHCQCRQQRLLTMNTPCYQAI